MCANMFGIQAKGYHKKFDFRSLIRRVNDNQSLYTDQGFFHVKAMTNCFLNENIRLRSANYLLLLSGYQQSQIKTW